MKRVKKETILEKIQKEIKRAGVLAIQTSQDPRIQQAYHYDQDFAVMAAQPIS